MDSTKVSGTFDAGSIPAGSTDERKMTEYDKKAKMEKKILQPGIDYIGVGTCAICHDGRGRIFLNQRSALCRDEWGKWDNCGGALKFAETPEECVRRELREEYGCEALECASGGFVNAIRQINGKKTHWLILTYLVRVDPKEVKINEPKKFTAGKWFTLNDLPEERHSYFDRDFASIKHLWDAYYSSCSSTDRTAAS